MFSLTSQLCERNYTSYPSIRQKIPFFQMNLGSCLSVVYLRNSHCLRPWSIYFRILYVLKKEVGLEIPRACVGLKICKPYSCPDLRPKTEPGDSDRDINCLLDRRPHTKGPGVAPHLCGAVILDFPLTIVMVFHILPFPILTAFSPSVNLMPGM